MRRCTDVRRSAAAAAKVRHTAAATTAMRRAAAMRGGAPWRAAMLVLGRCRPAGQKRDQSSRTYYSSCELPRAHDTNPLWSIFC